MADPWMDVDAAPQAALTPSAAELGNLEVLQDIETVEKPKRQGWVLALSISAFAVGGVSLAAVLSLGLIAILDIAGILAR